MLYIDPTAGATEVSEHNAIALNVLQRVGHRGDDLYESPN
jgi:hypothetical protein